MHIAIVGAGIAGLTLEAALPQAGMRCQVYEQASQPGEVGAGIQLAPNAARWLQRLGLTELFALGRRTPPGISNAAGGPTGSSSEQQRITWSQPQGSQPLARRLTWPLTCTFVVFYVAYYR